MSFATIVTSGLAATSLRWRLYRLINKPYYWFRPAQLPRRAQLARRALLSRRGDQRPRLVRTAWGSALYCWPDPLGQAVARTGVYDLVVAETLARLADPGELAIDAGANVGFMAAVLAHAVGPEGRVLAFEAHPLISEMLKRNVAHWHEHEGIDVIDARFAALSESAGSVPLGVDPAGFDHNKGTASLEHLQGSPASTVQVSATRLDDELAEAVGVCKLDVEGHELAVLKGARSLLARGLIRDILFEEHTRPPTPVTELLTGLGYAVLGVRQGLTGPVVTDPAQLYERRLWDPPALLATRDERRARERLRRRGWVCLRPGLHR
jgi:FkbM family methyltransferase